MEESFLQNEGGYRDGLELQKGVQRNLRIIKVFGQPISFITVEPSIMKPPKSEKPVVMKFFQCTICIHFNTFVPLNKENLQ